MSTSFNPNLPSPQRFYRIGRVTDWKSIDLQLSEEIGVACQEILNSPGFPIRVSLSEITRRISKQSWFGKRKEKLPKTNEIVNRNSESLEDFMLRKIEWTKEQYIKKNKIPTSNQFQIRAVVRNSTSFNSLKVQSAILDALAQINRSIVL